MGSVSLRRSAAQRVQYVGVGRARGSVSKQSMMGMLMMMHGHSFVAVVAVVAARGPSEGFGGFGGVPPNKP